jgi:hypothetical protein
MLRGITSKCYHNYMWAFPNCTSLELT